MRDIRKKYGKLDPNIPQPPDIQDVKHYAVDFNNVQKSELEALVTRAGQTIGAEAAITSIVRSGTTVTVTTTAAHGLISGLWVDILGAVQYQYNGIQDITVTGLNTFTFQIVSTPVSPATGTLTYYVQQLPKAIADTILNSNFLAEALGSGTTAYILQRDVASDLEIPTDYAGGLFAFKVVHTSSGAATINVLGLGVKAFVRASGAALQAGDIVVPEIAIVTYDAGTDKVVLLGSFSGEKSAVDIDVVHKAGTETITGDKNFTGLLQKDGGNVAIDSEVVHLAGYETMTSVKNFAAGFRLDSLYDFHDAVQGVTDNTTMVTKGFVDDKISNIGYAGTWSGELDKGASKNTLWNKIEAMDAAIAAIQRPLAVIHDEKPSGTAGGFFDNDNIWYARDLNTIKANHIIGLSLLLNQITIPAGTYYVHARAPALTVAGHKTRLRNITDGSDLLEGDSPNGSSFFQADPVTSFSTIMGEFTIAAAKVVEIQHIASNDSQPSIGFGFPLGLAGYNEIYTTISIWKTG